MGNPSWPSNSKTPRSIFFKLTVPSCFVANLMHVKRHLSTSIISNTFPSRFCPKSANFGGWGYSNGLISVTVWCTSTPFQIWIAQMQGFPKMVTFLSCNQRFRSLSDFKSDAKVKIWGGSGPSTLFFRGKMTPSAARRSGRPPGMLPRPAGRTPSRGCRGSFPESTQNLCTLVQKVAHSTDSFVTLREKVV